MSISQQLKLVIGSVFLFSVLPLISAASSVGVYEKIWHEDPTKNFYPNFIDREWTLEDGIFFTLGKYHASHVAYELFGQFSTQIIREGTGDVISNGSQVFAGEIVIIETLLPSIGLVRHHDDLSIENWSATYSYNTVPPFTSSATTTPELVHSSHDAGWIESLGAINRDVIVSNSTNHLGLTSGNSYRLSTFLEQPDVDISFSGDATLVDLGEGRYRVESEGSLDISIVLPEVTGVMFFVMTEEEIDRIQDFYNSEGPESDLELLMQDRLQNLASKITDGYAIEQISFSPFGNNFTLPSAEVSYTFNSSNNGEYDTLNSPYVSITSHIDTESVVVGEEVVFEYGTSEPQDILIRYKLDWDKAGSEFYEMLPEDFIIDSEVNTVTRTYSEPGDYSLGVVTFAFDSDTGEWKSSEYTDIDFTVLPAAPTVSLESRVNSGSWNSSNREVTETDVVQLRWDSSGADTCTGTNFSTSGATSNTGMTISLPTPGSSQTYTLTCSNVSGDSNTSISVTVLTEPPPLRVEVTSQVLSPGYEPTTGNYDTYTINTNFINNTGSAIPAPVNYTATFDNLQNGIIDVTSSGSVGSAIPPGGSVPVSIVFTDVPFGPATVTVSVDYPGFNGLDMNDLIPPPNPSLQLNINPTIAPAGRSAELTWSMLAQYPMDCTIIGGEVNHSFDPSEIGLQSIEPILTGRLRSMMTYRLQCVEPVTAITFSDSVRVEVVGRQIGR